MKQQANNVGGSMEMLKSQMMTMMMFTSVNNKDGTDGAAATMYNMLMMMVLTQFFEWITMYLPSIIVYLQSKWSKNLEKINVLTTVVDPIYVKTASITVHVKLSDLENMIGQALLDHITNNVNTKHISFRKQLFLLNQKDEIDIGNDMIVMLKDQQVDDREKNDESEQCIELYSNKKTVIELRQFLTSVTRTHTINIQNKLGDRVYYFNQHPITAPRSQDGSKNYSALPNNIAFTMKEFKTNRRFCNLFGPEIKAVRKRVEFFIKNKGWYDTKGIPYTLGLLLSGQAGAGKTSTIKCLANETHRHIININLNNDITKIQLENLFFSETIVVLNVASGQTEKYCIPLDKRIYVLEDIDCQTDLVKERTLGKDDPCNTTTEFQPSNHSGCVGQSLDVDMWGNETRTKILRRPKHEVSTEKLDMSMLLNILDGILENPGRIVVMTSNHPETLDHALIRPGRIDVIANFTRCTSDTMIEMVEFFYETKLSPDDKRLLNNVDDFTYSPAELSKIMFEYITDKSGALSVICAKP
jgi:hypothetical protein